jgi:ABC transport system ATP-binding/permease protein
MPPEHPDWPGQQQPQAGPLGPAPAGFAQAGLAEAPASAGPGGTSAAPALVVRTRSSEHTLHGGTTYRIGRDPQSEIVVADSRVSWRHGALRVEGDGWVLEDVGSTNGTFIGLHRIDRVPIAADCVVRLGNPDDGPVLRCMPQGARPAPVEPRRLAEPAAPFQQAPPFEPAPPFQQAAPLQQAQPFEAAPPFEPAPPIWPSTPDSLREPPSPRAASPQAPPRQAPPRQAPPPPAPPPQSAPAGAPAPVIPRDLRPSVDRRPTSRMPLPAKALRIGRVADNDLVLPDLDVSRHHAELRKSPTGTYEIVDLGSHNGVFVNGRRVSSAVLGEADIVSIGRSTFRLAGGELRVFVDEGEVTFSAQDLVVKVGGGKILLNRVTFPIPEKSLVGVIGPSGAGKSTLLGALTGMRPADTGTVLYDNRDLYRNYAELRYRIGLVPQESVLHTQLTARRALQYSAELRFPSDTGANERDARVDEVMAELGLTKHANTRADRLSGGQLKRVNVAQELLTKPSLLFLDEPTSGLDPGLDKSVMEQMRDLAHDGRTVIVVTHSVANLDTCDRLLVLVPGGNIAYYGPPDEGLKYFGLAGWAEVFQAFERYPDRDWAAEYAASQAHAQYVLGQRPKPPTKAQDESSIPEAVPQPRGALHQMGTLTRRYIRVIAADRGYLTITALVPLLLGVLIRFFPSKEGLAGAPGTNTAALELLVILVICACLAGAFSSGRELVKERNIYIRERAAGLSSGAYLSSKLLVLGVISIVQSVVLTLLVLAGRKMPSHGSVLGSPLLELTIAIALVGLASMCLGLLVSAMVNTSEKAMPILVVLTLFQVVLCGALLSLNGTAGLKQLAWLAPSRWGFAAVASTVNLNVINPSVAGNFTDPLWDHSAANWLRDVGILIGLGVAFSLLAWIRLRRIGPRRRKG